MSNVTVYWIFLKVTMIYFSVLHLSIILSSYLSGSLRRALYPSLAASGVISALKLVLSEAVATEVVYFRAEVAFETRNSCI